MPKKAEGKADKKKPKLKTPAHGRGKIWAGPPANPVAGTGRPPSAIRSRLRGSFDERLPILEEIADGIVKLRLVGVCEACGHEEEDELQAPEVARALRQAATADRLRALDIMAKVGLGPAKPGLDEELLGELAAAVQAEVDDDEVLKGIHKRWVQVIGEHSRKA